MEEVYKTRKEKGKIIIELDINALSEDIENVMCYEFKITDKEKFADYLVKNLLFYGEDETGFTDFWRIIEGLAVQAYENCEDFIVNTLDE
ncbi:MAG: hypothetical protein PWQ82_1171 [Thermosediminibacterales bacterium]|nr:hypothetical protein [Thermosediminibacterales bacterium]